MLDKIKKPTFYEAPKTYAPNQLYEPIKFYKLVKQQEEDRALENRVRDCLLYTSLSPRDRG